jgi:hypothetical protein
MSYRIFDGFMSPQASDGYVHVTEAGDPIYLFDGYNFGFFVSSGAGTFDGGKGIIYLPGATVAPTGNPFGGVFIYADGYGDIYTKNTSGLVQSLDSTLITRDITIDANYTAVQADYQAKIMEFTSSVTLTSTRNVMVPLIKGYQWTIFNNTTGGQSIQIIGVSGTGITIANGKRAIVYVDGTNVVRVTSDI